MTRQIARIVLIIFIIAGSTACTTTTKKLTTTEPRIDSTSQLEKARQAFNQKNFPEAASLLAPLAQQGDPDAQYALGYLYHNGLGVPRNYKLAIQWMTAASAKGNEKATEALRRISELGSEVTDNNLGESETQANTENASIKPIIIRGDKSKESELQKSTDTVTPAAPAPAPVASNATPSAVATDPTPEPETPPEPATTPVPENTEEVSTESESSPGTRTSDYSEHEKWILEQPESNFTVQLIATGNQVDLKRFIDENNLSESAVYYRTTRKNKDWYTLVQGSFDSPTAARASIAELPGNIQSLKPWVKPIAGVQEALSTRQ
ncbi:SPOR domain-containing protein [Kaarinaea lacus]